MAVSFDATGSRQTFFSKPANTTANTVYTCALGVGDTATLELTAQQAEIITVALQMADRLTLALRSVADAQETNLEEADYLVTGNGRRGTVRLIKNGVVSEEGARK